jgi:hypothetical protein
MTDKSAKKTRKRSALKDLPPKNAKKVKGGDTFSTLATVQKTQTDTTKSIIQNIR